MSNAPEKPPGGPYDSPSLEMPPQGELPNKDERQSAMLAHLLGALLGFLGPLIIYLTKKDDSPFVEQEAKEALNFQLTMMIGIVVTSIVGMMLSCFTFGLSMFLPVVPWLMQVIFGIIGGMQANEGRHYEYPISIRMIT